MGCFIPKKPNRGKVWGAFRKMRCPHCNLTYRNFKMPISRDDVYQLLKSEQHDPKHKRQHVTLRTFLGKMHEIKMEAWEEHKETCAVTHGLISPIDIFGSTDTSERVY